MTAIKELILWLRKYGRDEEADKIEALLTQQSLDKEQNI